MIKGSTFDNWHVSDYGKLTLYVENFEIGSKAAYKDEDGKIHLGRVVNVVSGITTNWKYDVETETIEKAGYECTGEFIEDDKCYFVAIQTA